MGSIALIGLGTNLGDRKAILDLAVAALSATFRIDVLAVSAYHETAPVGGPKGQGPFLNAAVMADVDLAPFDLLTRLQTIEEVAGRKRKIRWGERTLDLDILLFGSMRLSATTLTLPHPRMAVRRFVMAPAVEVAPGLIHPPTRRTLANLLSCLDRRPSVLALTGPPCALKRQVFASVCDTLCPQTTQQSSDDAHDTDSFENIIHLRPSPSKQLGGRWIVLDAKGDLEHLVISDLLTSFAPQAESANEIILAHENEVPLNTRKHEDVPTFAVLVDPSHTTGHDCKNVPFPVIRPEGSKPVEIIEEVLAACMATRTG